MYGTYKVIEMVIEPNPRKEGCVNTMWKCENIYTGKIKKFRGAYLNQIPKRNNNTNQLGLRKRLWSSLLIGAKNRGHEVTITFDDFDNLKSQNCYYCNNEPKQISNKIIIHNGNTRELPIFVNGIDRKNPHIGYTLDNCVPCCSECNYMKHVQTEEYFLSQIEKIYLFKIKKGSTTIPEGSTSQANGDGSSGHPRLPSEWNKSNRMKI